MNTHRTASDRATRRSRSLRTGWAGTFLAVCLMAAGCGDDPERSAPNASTTTPNTSYEQVVDLVSLSGNDVVPVHWEDPGRDTRDPDLTQALLTAQRYKSLSEYVFHTPRPKIYGDAFRALIENPRLLKTSIPYSENADPNHGHRLDIWFRVMQVERKQSGDVLVTTCVDNYWNSGWVHPVRSGETRKSFEPELSRVLVGQRLYEGTPRWRVLDVGANADPKGGERYEAVCEKWNHEHTEQPAPLPPDLVILKPT